MTTRIAMGLALALCFAGACGDDSAAPIDSSVPDGEADADADAAPQGSLPLQFEEIGWSVDLATGFAFLPGSTAELLVISHNGTVRHLRIEPTDSATTLGEFDVPDVEQDGDCGLLQIAVHPSWATNGFVYFGHCNSDYDATVTRVRFDGSNYSEAPSTAAVVVELPVPPISFANTNHTVGSIGFEPDGTFWMLVGDRGSEDGQDVSAPKSALLRMVLSDETPPGPAAPAPGNAFASPAEGAPEIYAYGIRYGWRATLDSLGRWWVGDVGGAEFEEINLVTAAGDNFGWILCEGPCEPGIGANTLPPITAWPHGTDMHPYFGEDSETEPTTRRTAWVGVEYIPSTVDRYDGMLTNKVLFGDACLGWVRAATANPDRTIATDEFVGHLANVTQWRQGPDGYLYATTFGSCDSRSPATARFVRAVLSASR